MKILNCFNNVINHRPLGHLLVLEDSEEQNCYVWGVGFQISVGALYKTSINDAYATQAKLKIT